MPALRPHSSTSLPLPLLLLAFVAAVVATQPFDMDDDSTVNCSTITDLAEGPYWVEEDINTDNLRVDLEYGLPLNLTFLVLDASKSNSNTCVPFENVRLDIWQSRYDGKYSDEEKESTLGELWLRGYQFTNSSGYATFYTIYPGWYTSRSVHVHLRVRVYCDNGTVCYEATTQLFFDDAITDAIDLHVYPYNARSSKRDTINSDDSLFTMANLINLNGNYNDSSGYSSEIIVISVPFADSRHSVKRGGSGLMGGGSGLGGGDGHISNVS